MYDDSNFAFDLMDVISEEDISEKITATEVIELSVDIERRMFDEYASRHIKWICLLIRLLFGEVSNILVSNKKNSFSEYTCLSRKKDTSTVTSKRLCFFR